MIGFSLSHAKYAARHLFEAVTKVTRSPQSTLLALLSPVG